MVKQVIEIEMPKTRNAVKGSLAVYDGSKWVFLKKEAYLSEYVKRINDMSAEIAQYRAKFEEIEKQWTLYKEEEETRFKELKNALNERLSTYHDALKVMTDGE